MGDVVASNAFLAARAAATRTSLDAGHWLYLYVNDFVPTPASELLAFEEASFPGYAPVNLAALWSVPIKVRDGEYVLAIPNQNYTVTGVTTETVFGWYIRKAAVVQFSARLPLPIELSFGANFLIGIAIRELALSVLV